MKRSMKVCVAVFCADLNIVMSLSGFQQHTSSWAGKACTLWYCKVHVDKVQPWYRGVKGKLETANRHWAERKTVG